MNVPFYAPIVLAKLLTTIDRRSGGRLDAGLGLGWSPAEFEAVGISSDRRGARGEDLLRAIGTAATSLATATTLRPTSRDSTPDQEPDGTTVRTASTDPGTPRTTSPSGSSTAAVIPTTTTTG